MSLVGNIVRGVTIIGAAVGLSSMYSYQRTMHHNYDAAESQVHQLKAQSAIEAKKHPTVRTVSTDYQNAMNAAKTFLNYQNDLHDQKSVTKPAAQAYIKKIQAMVGVPGQLTTPLVSNQVKGWQAKISYGGEDSDGDVSMAYRFYDQKKTLMNVTIFSYNNQTNKLGHFISFPTKAGQVALQKTLRG